MAAATSETAFDCVAPGFEPGARRFEYFRARQLNHADRSFSQNTQRRHNTLDRRTPDAVYFNQFSPDLAA
jgi:hypothetical protein